MKPGSQNLDHHLGDQDGTAFLSQDSSNTSFYSLASHNDYYSFSSLKSIPKLLDELNTSSGREREVLQDLNQSQGIYYSFFFDNEKNQSLNNRSTHPAKRLKNLMVKELQDPSNRSSSKTHSEEFTLGVNSIPSSPLDRVDTPKLNCTSDQIHQDQTIQSNSLKYFKSLGASIQNPREGPYLQENSKDSKLDLNDDLEKLDTYTKTSLQQIGSFNRLEEVTISNTNNNENFVHEVVVNNENPSTLDDQKFYGSNIDYKLKNYYQGKSELISQTLEKYKNQINFQDQGCKPKLDYKAYITSLKLVTEDITTQDNTKKLNDFLHQKISFGYEKSTHIETQNNQKLENPVQAQSIERKEKREITLQDDQHNTIPDSKIFELKEEPQVINTTPNQEDSLKLPKHFEQQAVSIQQEGNTDLLKEAEPQEQATTNENKECQSDSLRKNVFVETIQENDLNIGSNVIHESAINLINQEPINSQEQGDQNDTVDLVTTETVSDHKPLNEESDVVQVEEETTFFDRINASQYNPDIQQLEITTKPQEQIEKEKSNINKVVENTQDFENRNSEISNSKELLHSNIHTDGATGSLKIADKSDRNKDTPEKGEEERAIIIEKVETPTNGIVNRELSNAHDQQEVASLNAHSFALEAEEKAKQTSPDKKEFSPIIYQSKTSTPEKVSINTEYRGTNLPQQVKCESPAKSQPLVNSNIENTEVLKEISSNFENIPNKTQVESDAEKPKETIIIASDPIHNLDTKTNTSYGTQYKEREADENIPETNKVLPIEPKIEHASVKVDEPLFINHIVTASHQNNNNKNQPQKKEIPSEQTRNSQEDQIDRDIENDQDQLPIERANDFETIKTRRSDKAPVESSQGKQINHFEIESPEVTPSNCLLEVKEEPVAKLQLDERSQNKHSPHIYDHPPVSKHEESEGCPQIEVCNNEVNYSSPDKQSQHLSGHTPQERARERRNNSMLDSPQPLSEDEIRSIISKSMNSESRDTSKNKTKSASKSPKKHEDADVALQESFHKFYELKKKEMLRQASSFDERMQTDIKFRRQQENALDQVVQETKTRVSPRGKLELPVYQRLMQDTKQRNKKRIVKSVEQEDLQIRSKEKERTNQNEAAQNYIDHMAKDANIRSTLIKERERLRAEMQSVIIEKLQSTDTHRTADDVMKLISKIWEDANTCKFNKEKMIFMKVADEIRSVYEHANERLRGREVTKAQQTSASKSISTIPNSPKEIRSITPKTETRFRSRLSPDSKSFNSPNSSHLEDYSRIRSPKQFINKNSERESELKRFLENERAHSGQKYYRERSKERQIEAEPEPFYRNQSELYSPQYRYTKFETKTSRLEQSEVQSTLMMERSPQRSEFSTTRSAVIEKEPKNKMFSPNAKLMAKSKPESARSPDTKVFRLTKELSEKYKSILKENPFIKRRGQK